MRAAVITSTDAPPRADDVDDPTASDGDAVVAVRVAGINPVDLYRASGQLGDIPLPSVAGSEGVSNASPKPASSTLDDTSSLREMLRRWNSTVARAGLQVARGGAAEARGAQAVCAAGGGRMASANAAARSTGRM
jgi:hypothetical protein